MSDDVVIPEALVPYVAMACRIALEGLKEDSSEIREMLAETKDEKVPGVIRISLENKATHLEELRAEAVAAFRHLPDTIRPRDDLME